jgi:crotonobetainyl-CoA:carnitine CoA-transferase CaiB-like acyl-CoA transferase
MSRPTHRPPLAGVTVLDLTRLLPGPLCTQHLADMGARVIKVEDPKTGDVTRYSGAPNGDSVVFEILNGNKEGLVLDLKDPADQAHLLDLAAEVDVLVEGFRPGVLERLGCGYPAAAARNPRLVYCSITGYGQTGPRRDRAGHDINYIAESGIADQIGAADGPPVLSNFQIGDLAGGTLTAAMGILAALFDAARSGQGRHVDIAMTDGAMAHAVIAAGSLAMEGQTPRRGMGKISGALPCYGYYQTADQRYLAVGALEPQFWRSLCEAIARPDLIPHGHANGPQGDAVKADLAAIFAQRPMAEWVTLFDRYDCCVSGVLTLEEARASAQAQARGLIDGAGFACPVKMTDFAPQPRRPAPPLKR